MKLTKLVHACVLVEDENHVGLFDPGVFSSSLIKLDSLPKIDHVMITHEHPDHCDENIVKTIAAQYPEAKFYTNDSIIAKLKALGITNATTQSDEMVEIVPLLHESMAPLTPDPNALNVAIHYKGRVSHPGDSHHLTKTDDILCLPLAGPWGATVEGIRMAMQLKPKVIVPIHDWMWNEQWRSDMYERLEQFFETQGIRFVKTVDGQSFEV